MKKLVWLVSWVACHFELCTGVESLALAQMSDEGGICTHWFGLFWAAGATAWHSYAGCFLCVSPGSGSTTCALSRSDSGCWTKFAYPACFVWFFSPLHLTWERHIAALLLLLSTPLIPTWVSLLHNHLIRVEVAPWYSGSHCNTFLLCHILFLLLSLGHQKLQAQVDHVLLVVLVLVCTPYKAEMKVTWSLELG